jgi:Collagen triple helix repeat (20 copies)
LRRIASYVKRHHLALFALFFALGGTSFAATNAVLAKNSVGTRQVIDGSLQTSDLSKTARSALKGNRGLAGPAGPAGTAGTAGPAGPAGAPGLQGNQGPTGATGARGDQGVPGQAATAIFVAVNAEGTISKSSGANAVSRANAGVYRIEFGADITNCVYIATAGEDAGAFVEDYHLYTSRTAAHTVNVAIFDENDDPLDRSFYLAVVC